MAQSLDDNNALDLMNNAQTDTDPTPNQLSDDEPIEVDYDAKESGFGPYTPQVYPGVYPFLFALEDENPFEVRKYTPATGQDAGHEVKEFTVNHKGTISITGEDGTPKEVTIRFNRAGFRRTQKMKDKKMNSRGGELLRTLSIPPAQATSQQSIEAALREADGRVMGRGVVNWEAYCKEHKQVVSTSPNRKRGDATWPKVNGRYAENVQCPQCRAAAAAAKTDPNQVASLDGREKITDYRLPQE